MKCEDVNRYVIFTLVLVVIADIIVLWTELTDQRCEAKAEKERAANDRFIKKELAELRSQIQELRLQLGHPPDSGP
jgi:hypothetical protein